ncbi:beta/gamma crystallin-related protein [Paucibacter sp. APW11]|uniref:Beta/gamma crystallin-related protein n=1 Tax=Roseateles aquae TaxID=3077235 RepID=A0ABU3P5A3_9BURK|nr:beta/gamma crystallin-related protein [Paucibacter sp. APW11]MDT8997756.1 beta/gamma crystallin-related protein [Paucibacter sp. APW11]
MNARSGRKALRLCAIALLLPSLGLSSAWAQLSLYEGTDFRGQLLQLDRPLSRLQRSGFNDRASSAVVGQGAWEVCEGNDYAGRCRVLRPGSYASLQGMNLNNRISSARPVDEDRRFDNEAPVGAIMPSYEYRRRPQERLYQAEVLSARAVYGTPQQRCWLEHEQPSRGRSNSSGGAIVGALIGGILGHQIGGGTGRDLATAGGAVAGAVIGSRAGGDREEAGDGRQIQRCETAVDGPPQYWDISYRHAGQLHRAQLSMAPGATISVNARGEPRQ